MTHEATVTVTLSGTNPVVSVSDAKLKPKGKKTLKWTMGTPGWKFPSNGIVIPTNAGQFTNFSPSSDGQTYTVDDANTDTLGYNYTINVQATANPKLAAALDPMIQNGDGNR
jgi:hypothetical protein